LIQASTLGTKVNVSHGLDFFRAGGLAVQRNCGISVEKGNDILGNKACGCYLEDSLIRANSHMSAKIITLEKEQKCFEQPM